MLLPALNQARERARSINCVSNLKNNMLAYSLYADDYKGNMKTFQQTPNFRTWANILYDNGYLKKNADIIACPSSKYRATSAANASIYNAYGVVAYPGFLFQTTCGVRDSVSGNQFLVVKRVPHPSKMAVLADCLNGTVFAANPHADQYYAFAPCESGWNQTYYARHSNKISIGFVDGHAGLIQPADIPQFGRKNGMTRYAGLNVGASTDNQTYYYFDVNAVKRGAY